MLEVEQDRVEESSIATRELPVLPLKNTVIFPLTVFPLVVQKPRSVRLVDDAVLADRTVALVALKDPEIEEPSPGDLYEMGTMATIHRLARSPDGTLHIIVQGLERIRVVDFTQSEPYMRARVATIPDVAVSGVEMEALVRSVTDLFRRLVGLAAYLPEDAVSNVLSTEDPRQLAYMIATSTRMEMCYAPGDPGAGPGLRQAAPADASAHARSGGAGAGQKDPDRCPVRRSKSCSASIFCASR